MTCPEHLVQQADGGFDRVREVASVGADVNVPGIGAKGNVCSLLALP